MIGQNCIHSLWCKWTLEDVESNSILSLTMFIQTRSKFSTTESTKDSNWMNNRIINLDLMNGNTRPISKTKNTPPSGFKQQTTTGDAFQTLWYMRTMEKLEFKSTTDWKKKSWKRQIKSWELACSLESIHACSLVHQLKRLKVAKIGTCKISKLLAITKELSSTYLSFNMFGQNMAILMSI